VKRVFVVGVGMTAFGKFELSLADLGRESAFEAVQDAGVSRRDVDLIACGSARSGSLQARESGVGQLIGWELGIQGVPVYNEKAFCASGTMALSVAHTRLLAGLGEVALVVGVEKMSRRSEKGKPLTSDGMVLEGELGFTPSVYYAMAAKRHMAIYGTTREQIASVAVKNRRHASSNPKAQYRKTITLADVLGSRPIVEPLNLLDCCPTGDGGAAAIIATEDAVARLGLRPLAEVRACVVGSGLYSENLRDMTSFNLDRATATQAYEQAGIGPSEVDVAEVHDSFSIAEIIHYEDLGLCERGEGGKLVQDGATAIGGRVAVNPSGGLLNRGHPLGATGVAQIVELTEQLARRSGARQVEDAKVALAHISGGFHEGDFATSGVTILTGIGLGER
jgi:acetyl-CoA acetyltransferase